MALGPRMLGFAIAGIVIGAIVGGIAGASAGKIGLILLGVLGGGIIGGILLGLCGLLPVEFWDLISGIFAVVECCSTSVILFVASVISISSFMLWHSLLLALLSGVTTMTVSLIVLSLAIYIHNVRYDGQLLRNNNPLIEGMRI